MIKLSVKEREKETLRAIERDRVRIKNMSTIALYQNGNTYDGTMTVTPSAVRQELATDGKLLNGNIVIEPVPGSWGQITWNGSTLTVY